MRVVEVRWVDSHMMGPGWEDMETARAMRPARCRSVGYVVRDAPEGITLAQSANRFDVGNLVCIPRECVRRVRRLG